MVFGEACEGVKEGRRGERQDRERKNGKKKNAILSNNLVHGVLVLHLQ